MSILYGKINRKLFSLYLKQTSRSTVFSRVETIQIINSIKENITKCYVSQY